MYFFELQTFAVTASFRIPETHTFQQTLPLPPITTLTGLLGAAAGWSFQEAVHFCQEHGIKLGVIGTCQGRFKDLWKYQKIKSDGRISAVLLREYLADLAMCIYITADDRRIVDKLRGSFLNPCYALTAGNSDDLLKIKRVGNVVPGEVIESFQFSHTILAGNHVGNYESMIDLNTVPLMQEIYAPQVYLLPTEFEFNGEERRVRKRKPFTFVDTPIKLRKPIMALQVGDKAVELL